MGCKVSPRPDRLVSAVLPVDHVLGVWPHPIGEVIHDVGWLGGTSVGLLVLGRLGVDVLELSEVGAALLGSKPYYLWYVILNDVS